MSEEIKKNITVRPIMASDRIPISVFLSFLSANYPNSEEWLDERLDETFHGTADAYIAEDNSDGLAGVIMGIPSKTKYKLTCFFVDEHYRGVGVGAKLLDCILEDAREAKLKTICMTSPYAPLDSLFPFLESQGFQLITVEPNRYGEGHHEAVFERPIDIPE